MEKLGRYKWVNTQLLPLLVYEIMIGKTWSFVLIICLIRCYRVVQKFLRKQFKKRAFYSSVLFIAPLRYFNIISSMLQPYSNQQFLILFPLSDLISADYPESHCFNIGLFNIAHDYCHTTHPGTAYRQARTASAVASFSFWCNVNNRFVCKYERLIAA